MPTTHGDEFLSVVHIPADIVWFIRCGVMIDYCNTKYFMHQEGFHALQQ